jgi:hypothetical protein
MDRGSRGSPRRVTDRVVAEGGQCGERRRATGQLRWSPTEKKRLVRLATHQGFLSNKEGGQGVTGADESTKNLHSGTVHRGGGQLEMRWSRWVLMGKEWLGGTEEDTCPDPTH